MIGVVIGTNIHSDLPDKNQTPSFQRHSILTKILDAAKDKEPGAWMPISA
jgi:hypothetical protein